MAKRDSRLRRGALDGVGLVAIVLLCSSATLAQSAIAGVVKDATGSVLPGVTVGAASPSLIERVRTVVTDAQGQYKIVDLRPGPYEVTFSLAGFATVKQAGIQLPANSSAAFNEVQTYGSSLGRPTDVIQGRIFRFGAQMKF